MDKKKRELIPHKPGIYEKYIKRPQDFILSVIAIIVLSPVLVLIAVLVRIKLGSPVLFKQQRPGLNGKIFNMYKFRTMTDKRGENVYTVAEMCQPLLLCQSSHFLQMWKCGRG